MSSSVGSVDAAVLVLYLCAAMGLGLWLGRAKQDLQGYLLAGRNLPWWAILGSIVATETSTVTFLSIPGLAFNPDGGNLQLLQLAAGYIIGRCLIVIVLLPLYFRGNLYTAYEVLDKRFGPGVKRLASVIFLTARNLGDSLRLFLTALVLERLLNLSLPWCIAVVGVITIAYTFFGGMRSVVWNDCIQFVVYMAGGLLALWIILDKIPGGWQEYSVYGQAQGKFQWLTPGGNPLEIKFWTGLTFWSGLIGGMFLTLGTHGADQMIVQRYLCAKSQRHASSALILSGLVVFLQFALFLLIGIGLAAFYHHHPPAEAFSRNDEVFAAFILDHMPQNVGIVGILLAAVFAAAMSTLSSSLNSSAASVVNDLAPNRPVIGKASKAGKAGKESNDGEDRRIGWARLWTIGFGLLQMGIALAAMGLSESVIENALAIAGFSAGVLLGVFALGVFTDRVGQEEAAAGMIIGVCVLAAVKFLTPIHWTWFAVIGAAATFTGAILLYVVTGRRRY